MADVKWLEQAAVDYLLWMKKSGYSVFTIAAHKRLTGHFIAFVQKCGLKREEIFSHDTLKAFEKDYPLFLAACSVRGLARYLASRNVIAKPITKPVESLPKIYEDYLEFMEINKQVVLLTIGSTRRILTALNRYLRERNIALHHLRIEHLDDFLVGCNAGLKPATCRHNRSYLRGFLKYLHHNRKITGRDLSVLLVGAVDFAKTNPPKFFTPKEIKAIFAFREALDAGELRALAMVHLAFTLGLRPKEIARIDLDDISFAKGEICIAERKSLNPVMLPLPEAAIKAIAAYIVGARPESGLRRLFATLSGPVRPMTAATVGQVITRHLRRVNPLATAYWLRHTYAQNLLESDASIFEVKQMMGHDSVDTTRKYLFIHTRLMRKVLFDETL